MIDHIDMTLRLRERRYYPIVVAVGYVCVWIVWWFTPTFNKPEFLISATGAISALGYFLYRQHLERARFLRELFVTFNDRYDRLNDRMMEVLNRANRGELQPTHRQVLQDYFNLCAEEHFFFDAGYIDAVVWKSWLLGMAQYIEDEAVILFWKQELESGSYYDFTLASVFEAYEGLKKWRLKLSARV